MLYLAGVLVELSRVETNCDEHGELSRAGGTGIFHRSSAHRTGDDLRDCVCDSPVDEGFERNEIEESAELDQCRVELEPSAGRHCAGHGFDRFEDACSSARYRGGEVTWTDDTAGNPGTNNAIVEA
jgi:hypothetical protein